MSVIKGSIKFGAGLARTLDAISERKDFDAATVTGRMNSNGVFTIKSYDTEVAQWREASGWTLTTRKYSATTSMHLSTIRRALRTSGIDYTEKDFAGKDFWFEATYA